MLDVVDYGDDIPQRVAASDKRCEGLGFGGLGFRAQGLGFEV